MSGLLVVLGGGEPGGFTSYNRSLDIDAAQKMLVDALKWRRAVGIDLVGEVDAKKALVTAGSGCPFGHDKDGLPVL